ncbi:MAG: hypothetical protein IJQ89_07080 [Bacteroidales bacterium]|nr:hypothetical protein [Bacteroidales bacterium]
MTKPDGQKAMLSDSIMLRDTGSYRLTATVNGSDTLSLSFILTGGEEVVKVCINNPLPSCRDGNTKKTVFSIERHLFPPKNVEIETYKYKRRGRIEGPIFKIKNGSKDTLYGYFSPNFLWGWLEVFDNGKRTGWLFGTRDYQYNGGGKPLFPNSTKKATVGKSGIHVHAGIYRYHILYSTKPQNIGIPLTYKTSTRDRYTSVKSWYHLTCDFEIKYD